MYESYFSYHHTTFTGIKHDLVTRIVTNSPAVRVIVTGPPSDFGITPSMSGWIACLRPAIALSA